jgi:primase-polymerase (primpol)-like protein
MPNWVVWSWKRNNHAYTKPPYIAVAPDRLARNDDASTWAPRSAAVNAVLAGRANGVGFVLTNTEIGAVDLDKCRDLESGEIDDWAQSILDAAANTYCEITVSGTGARVLGIAKGQPVHRRFNRAGGRKGAAVEL